MQKLVAVGAGAVVVLLLLLAWIGGEVRYRNCLTEAELRNPIAAKWKPGHPGTAGEGIGGHPLGTPAPPPEPEPPEPAHFAFYGQKDRDAALNQCSHWPL
ncbi:MAG TPA: hypothetical protein VN752_01925 [Solirubrobacterales bacterium]|nr:hypothetical protein [Solirubrobacterales bacterium]